MKLNIPLASDIALEPDRSRSPLDGPIGALFRTIEAALVICLVVMIVMVFGNVVLRYVFNSGLAISEELSRFAFVWMTFLGAILAAKEGLHVGVDTLVVALPEWGQRACVVVSELFVIGCCAVFVWGTWQQHHVNATMKAAVSDLPLIWVFGVGYLTGAGIALISLVNIVHVLRGSPLNLGRDVKDIA